MQAGLWGGAVTALAIALFSGWRDWRRARRDNLDSVGIVDWPTVQMLALIMAVILASLGFKA